MIVCYAATRNIYHKMLPSIRSLTEHNDVQLVILAEDDEVPLEYPHKTINVSGIKVFNEKNTKTYFTWMTLMRLLLPELTDYDKILYLDVDTIVCEDLTLLWNLPMGDRWWAAVEEAKGWWKPFGLPYFNAGVSLYNLKQMREDNFVQTIVPDLNTNTYPFPDQDVINKYAVPHKVIPLTTRYNESFATGYTDNPAIVHFAGYNDWFENKSLFRHEFLERYTPPQSCF